MERISNNYAAGHTAHTRSSHSHTHREHDSFISLALLASLSLSRRLTLCPRRLNLCPRSLREISQYAAIHRRLGRLPSTITPTEGKEKQATLLTQRGKRLSQTNKACTIRIMSWCPARRSGRTRTLSHSLSHTRSARTRTRTRTRSSSSSSSPLCPFVARLLNSQQKHPSPTTHTRFFARAPSLSARAHTGARSPCGCRNAAGHAARCAVSLEDVCFGPLESRGGAPFSPQKSSASQLTHSSSPLACSLPASLRASADAESLEPRKPESSSIEDDESSGSRPSMPTAGRV